VTLPRPRNRMTARHPLENTALLHRTCRLPTSGTAESGGEGDRTPDLVNAIHALSQLSYAPISIVAPRKALWQHEKLAAPSGGVKLRAVAHVTESTAKSAHDSASQRSKISRARSLAIG
jgi:hypothetical protein